MQRSSVLVLGINPSDHTPKPNCTTLRRLPVWLEYMEVMKHTFLNCIAEPGAYRMKDVRMELVEQTAKAHDKVIALGNFPSNVLRKLDIEHFTLPHPSGLNRKLNSIEYEVTMLDRCAEYIHSS